VVALLSAAIGLALTPLTPAGVPVLAASAAALLGLRRGKGAADGDSARHPEIEGDPVG
jgi:hypothetical protein